jgi:hypothetical protein
VAQATFEENLRKHHSGDLRAAIQIVLPEFDRRAGTAHSFDVDDAVSKTPVQLLHEIENTWGVRKGLFMRVRELVARGRKMMRVMQPSMVDDDV